jgi:hypothetical protein
MIHRVVFVLLMVYPAVSFAQPEFGMKGGLNVSDIVITNYINPDVESDFRLKVGLHAGVFVKGMVNERMGLAAELHYSDKGVNDVHLRYITLPLLVQYKVAEKVFAEIGPEPSYLFSATSRYGNAANTYNNKFDLLLNAGILISVTRVMVGVRYCIGLFSVRDIENVGVPRNEQIKYQNRVLQLSIGYKLWSLE